MPILAREAHVYPDNLLEQDHVGKEEENRWWAIYTLSRREKELMRKLRVIDVPHFCPIIPKRNRSPAGRVRVSHVPLFTNYVFVYGDDQRRYEAVTTGCVSKCIPVADGPRLTHDLRQIHRLIESGERIMPEANIVAGERVRVRTGPFRDYEGKVVRREKETRLLIYVNFLGQGASVLLDDCEVERINRRCESEQAPRKRGSNGVIWSKSTETGNWQAVLSAH